MPSTKNQQQLTVIQEMANKAKSVVITDYSGLNVAQQTTLRSEIKKAGGEFYVGKNTLIKIALGKDELNKALEGQTGVLFSYEDEITPLKALVAFVKTAEKPVLKAGILAGKILSVADIKAYAQLPGKDELIVMLMQRVQGPTYGLLNALQGNARNLVYALQALATKKQSEGSQA